MYIVHMSTLYMHVSCDRGTIELSAVGLTVAVIEDAAELFEAGQAAVVAGAGGRPAEHIVPDGGTAVAAGRQPRLRGLPGAAPAPGVAVRGVPWGTLLRGVVTELLPLAGGQLETD